MSVDYSKTHIFAIDSSKNYFFSRQLPEIHFLTAYLPKINYLNDNSIMARLIENILLYYFRGIDWPFFGELANNFRCIVISGSNSMCRQSFSPIGETFFLEGKGRHTLHAAYYAMNLLFKLLLYSISIVYYTSTIQ